MGLGSPRAVLRARGHDRRRRRALLPTRDVDLGRRRAALPLDAAARPPSRVWFCIWRGHVRALPDQLGTAARPSSRSVRGAQAPTPAAGTSLEESVAGGPFWAPSLRGAGPSALVRAAARRRADLAAPPPCRLPLLAGVALGYALREGRQRRHTQSLLDLQSEEILYSNRAGEEVPRPRTRIEQLSLLTDLSAAVNATLDPEKIYDQALTGSSTAWATRGPTCSWWTLAPCVRGHRTAGAEPRRARSRARVPPRGRRRARARGPRAPASRHRQRRRADACPCTAPVRALRCGLVVRCRSAWRAGVRRARGDRERAGSLRRGDVDLLSAVASHVALAIDRAESFQTIEDLSPEPRGQGARPHRAAAGRQRGAAHRLP